MQGFHFVTLLKLSVIAGPYSLKTPLQIEQTMSDTTGLCLVLLCLCLLASGPET
jgi:hypothetical protein